MTSTSPTTATLVARYATEFNARFAGTHAVTSPFGAWLLLAVIAPAATGERRVALEQVLGCPADDARGRATELLATPHPAVSAAAAIWSQPGLVNAAYAEFIAGVDTAVARGPVPGQPDADRWAAERTAGMIDRFPVTLPPDTAMVVASALATDVSWVVPFGVAPAERLGGEFGDQITTTLVADDEHRQLLMRTDAAGLVAVHAADGADGLTVVSVIAAPDVAPAAVHEAAHQVAGRLARRDWWTEAVSLFDVAVGDGHAWTVTETVEERWGVRGDLQTFATTIPAWDATSTHPVLDADGFAEACSVLETFLRPELLPGTFSGAQTAVASFSRYGFRAAAVTAVAMRAGAMPSKAIVRHRHADLRFNRPYAVVAVVTGGPAAWQSVPVFSAWVATPADTTTGP